jgi:regulatory protein
MRRQPRLTDRRPKLRRQSNHKIDIRALADKLPGEVTSVEPQKYHADRVSLYVKGEFLAGISVYTREKIPIVTGDILTAEQLKAMLEMDEYPRLKNKLIELLSHRPHSRLELRQKATRKGFSAEIADEVINNLTKSGYVNDAEFAFALARDKFVRCKWGPNRIRACLLSKGIDEKLLNKVLEFTIDPDKLQHQIRQLLWNKNKKLVNEADSLKRKKKVYDFLIRKGYRHNDVMKVLEQEKF